MNKSLASSLMRDFTVIYSIFNCLIYVICVTLKALQRTDGNMKHIIFFVFYSFMNFISWSSVFLYDAFQPNFATPRFRAFLFGFSTICLTIPLISRYFDENAGNFQLHILGFALDIESIATSALSAITIFLLKNFIFALLQPNNLSVSENWQHICCNICCNICYRSQRPRQHML